MFSLIECQFDIYFRVYGINSEHFCIDNLTVVLTYWTGNKVVIMLRRLTSTIVQSRGIKNTVKIKWVRPEYVPAYKAERSGDLEAIPPIPQTAIGLDYALSDEIKE